MQQASGGNQAAIAARLHADLPTLSSAQIAGVLGNLQVESSLNPGSVNPAEGAHGIAQWEGGRWSGPNGLQAFAGAHGTAWSDLSTQVDFLAHELQTTERGALSALTAAGTPAAAATAFDQQYERSSPASLPARVAAAQQFAAGGMPGGAGAPGGAVQYATDPGGGGGGGGASLPGWLNAAGSFLVPGWQIDQAATASAGGMGGLLTKVGHWIMDGALILGGVLLLLVAIYLVASGGEGSGPTVPGPVGEGTRHTAEHLAEVAAA